MLAACPFCFSVDLDQKKLSLAGQAPSRTDGLFVGILLVVRECLAQCAAGASAI